MQSLLLILSALVVLMGRTQTYCQRGLVVTDTGGQCLKSGDYDVANCCYQCPVTQSDGTHIIQCLSLYDAPPSGYATCGQTGALAGRQQACVAIGGDITSTSFTCLCNGGTNMSQINSVPTAPNATGAPTTDGTRYSLTLGVFMFSFVVLFLGVM
jgi:hypothetical protein